MKNIPEWMEKYIPAMVEQFAGDKLEHIKTINDLISYRNSLPNHNHSFPNQFYFDMNMDIKISLLEIINRYFKLDSK
jgi:hypothetical protein